MARERSKQNLEGSGTSMTRPGAASAIRGEIPLVPPPTARQRARYAFDATMAKGPAALVAWLALLTLLLILLGVAVNLIFGLIPDGGRKSFVGALFNVLLHSLDPGTIGGDGGGWKFLVTMLVVTLAGLFIVSALIGVIATGIDEKLLELRKGRSFVVERDHTLVLGWSEAVFTIISELAIANESESKPVIVILADEDKVEMEDAIRAKVGDTRNTKVVCRTGSPIDLSDLSIANPTMARSVIVLAPSGEDPDAEVIKTVLALTRGPHRREDPYRIVAEIGDPANLEAARLVGGDQAVFIDKRETISKLIVQASRQSGASAVYGELLDFDGEEIYFREDAAVVGKSYGDALLAYDDAAVMGVRGPDGDVVVNPPMETVIGAGDQLIAVAADDSVLEQARPFEGSIDEAAISAWSRTAEPPQRVLLIGFNGRSVTVIEELDHYVAPDSAIHVVADRPEAAVAVEDVSANLTNLTLTTQTASTTDRATLESLQIRDFNQIIVMCYADHLDAQRADARTLVTLLHLRDIAAREGSDVSIVSEMLDDRNHELAQVTQVDDVIVSDKVLSLLLSQISENEHLADVFAELFSAAGSEVYLRPVEDYLAPGAQTIFATVVEAARRHGETALGLRVAAHFSDSSQQYGVRLNPSKSSAYEPALGDRVVVLAED